MYPNTVDDINPTLTQKRTYHNSHSLGSLRQCRVYIFNRSTYFGLKYSLYRYIGPEVYIISVHGTLGLQRGD